RLDERQARELGRQALAAEDLLHLGEVATRDADALGEALAQAALGPDARRIVQSRGEAARILVIAEEVPYLPLLVVEAAAVALARIETLEDSSDPLPLFRDGVALKDFEHELALARGRTVAEIENAVDAAQVLGIV